MKNKEILKRFKIARERANLTAEELSLKLGKKEDYIKRIENEELILRMPTLIDILKICNMPLEQFFYESIEQYDEDKVYLDKLHGLPYSLKLDILENLKKSKE